MTTPTYPETARWNAADAGRALAEAEAACRETGASGPTLTRYTDGWECTATFVSGRRFRETVRVAANRDPSVALMELADRVRGEGVCFACDHERHGGEEGPCCVLVRSGEGERICGCLE